MVTSACVAAPALARRRAFLLALAARLAPLPGARPDKMTGPILIVGALSPASARAAPAKTRWRPSRPLARLRERSGMAPCRQSLASLRQSAGSEGPSRRKSRRRRGQIKRVFDPAMMGEAAKPVDPTVGSKSPQRRRRVNSDAGERRSERVGAEDYIRAPALWLARENDLMARHETIQHALDASPVRPTQQRRQGAGRGGGGRIDLVAPI
jgi:hypothetical protein